MAGNVDVNSRGIHGGLTRATRRWRERQHCRGTLDVAGDVDVNSGKFTVASTTGNTVVAGTLNAGGLR